MNKTLQIILIISLSMLTSNCKNKLTETAKVTLTQNSDKYELNLATCAPNLYPAEVIDGSFTFADGTSQYIPSGAVLKTGWGGLAPIHVSGPDKKALPTEFTITWVSYIEKKFYRGTFKLDHNHIADLFKKGFINEQNKHLTYNEIKLGLAPGGLIIVWINGNGMQTEVARFSAKNIDVSKDYFIPNATVSIDTYIEETIKEDLPKQYQNTHFRNNIPFDLWDSYRNKYVWKPTIVFADKESEVISIIIDYFNGEKIFTHGKNKELLNYKERALPKYISIIWKDKNNNAFGARLQFGRKYDNDDDFTKTKNEIFDAFKIIDEQSNQSQLVIHIDEQRRDLKVSLLSDKNTISLNKYKRKIYKKTKK